MNYYECRLESLELRVLCDEICDKKNATAIYHALFRNGIRSIDDLRCRDLSVLFRYSSVGEMRLEFIKEMKETIENEEKIRSIMEADSDVMRLRNDVKICERADYLKGAGYSTRKIAETLGLREMTVRLIT